MADGTATDGRAFPNYSLGCKCWVVNDRRQIFVGADWRLPVNNLLQANPSLGAFGRELCATRGHQGSWIAILRSGSRTLMWRMEH